MDQALIELNSYMESKLNKPFDLSGLIDTINSTQEKLRPEHKSLQELQLNVDTLNEMKTIPKFSFHPLNALTYDTHKLVTGFILHSNFNTNATCLYVLFQCLHRFDIIMLWALQMHHIRI